jgi:hypothetical protein
MSADMQPAARSTEASHHNTIRLLLVSPAIDTQIEHFAKERQSAMLLDLQHGDQRSHLATALQAMCVISAQSGTLNASV